MRPVAALIVLSLLAACGRETPHGPIDVTVIGPPIMALAAAPMLDRRSLDAPALALIGATQQGLIRFDATGQVVPGLAARWIVSDDGRSVLFRLPDGGSTFGSAVIVRRLRAAIAPASRNPLKPLLGAIGEVDAVTPQVVDVELGAPRPNILALFAQPALGVGSTRGGGGPFDMVRLDRGVATLRQRTTPEVDGDAAPSPREQVRLRGEGAARAVARFVAGRAAIVLGGTVSDLAIARAADPPAGQLRFDPAPGLFGLAFAATADGLTADAGRRAALAMAIDRERIARLLAIPGWQTAVAVVVPGTPEIERPALPDWAVLPIAVRQDRARAALAGWSAAGRAIGPLRVAMPAGPGARLLFAAIAADWRAIGVPAIAVAADAPADLRLLDMVSPSDTAAFYLRAFACERGVPCTAASDRVLIAARTTASLAERSVLLRQADAMIAADAPFIALGSPVRWSLVSPALDLYRDSPRAIHPLDELRSPVMR